jgi:integrase/recombinase XerC/integrase/recombinase XerD
VALWPETITVEAATRRFLSERDLMQGTRRVYGDAFDHLAQTVGSDTPLDQVTEDDLRDHLDQRWGKAAPTTYNRNVAILRSLFGWAARRRLVRADPTVSIEHRRERTTRLQAERRRAIDYADLEACWTQKDIALREKTLWKMLYETAARANEVLALNIEDLDLAERSARIVGKGGHAQTIHWATGTARLLPRLIGDRTTGPVFMADRPPRTPMAKADLDPITGHARLSYRRAAELFSEASSGWTLHQLRHSAITHLAEDGVDLALLKAKSRHQSLRSLERYARPSEAAVAKLTADHDRARRR